VLQNLSVIRYGFHLLIGWSLLTPTISDIRITRFRALARQRAHVCPVYASGYCSCNLCSIAPYCGVEIVSVAVEYI